MSSITPIHAEGAGCNTACRYTKVYPIRTCHVLDRVFLKCYAGHDLLPGCCAATSTARHQHTISRIEWGWNSCAARPSNNHDPLRRQVMTGRSHCTTTFFRTMPLAVHATVDALAVGIEPHMGLLDFSNALVAFVRSMRRCTPAQAASQIMLPHAWRATLRRRQPHLLHIIWLATTMISMHPEGHNEPDGPSARCRTHLQLQCKRTNVSFHRHQPPGGMLVLVSHFWTV